MTHRHRKNTDTQRRRHTDTQTHRHKDIFGSCAFNDSGLGLAELNDPLILSVRLFEINSLDFQANSLRSSMGFFEDEDRLHCVASNTISRI